MKKIIVLILVLGSFSFAFGQSTVGDSAYVTFRSYAKCDSAWTFFGYPASNLYKSVKLIPPISADSVLLQGRVLLDSVGDHYVEIRYYLQGSEAIHYYIGKWMNADTIMRADLIPADSTILASIKTHTDSIVTDSNRVRSDMWAIDRKRTSGYLATLKLKKLDIYNPTGIGLQIESDAGSAVDIGSYGTGNSGLYISSTLGPGITVDGGTDGILIGGGEDGIDIDADEHAIALQGGTSLSTVKIDADGNAPGLEILGGNTSGDAVKIQSIDGNGINIIGAGAGHSDIVLAGDGRIHGTINNVDSSTDYYKHLIALASDSGATGGGGGADTTQNRAMIRNNWDPEADGKLSIEDVTAVCQGAGKNTVVIWVENNADSTGLSNFHVTIEDSISGTQGPTWNTNFAGVCTLGLDNGHYTIYLDAPRWIIASPVYRTITDNVTLTYYATLITPSPPPPGDSVCVVRGYVYEKDGTPCVGAKVRMWIDIENVTVHGVLVDVKTPVVTYTNTLGHYEFSDGVYPNALLLYRGEYKTKWAIDAVTKAMTRIGAKWITVPIADSYEVTIWGQ